MQLHPGQGILAKIPFKDGEMPAYDRTYLVVSVSDSHIGVLNVSSIKGKERKLAFPCNERLRVYRPPFEKPSFVKLDSLTSVPIADLKKFHVLGGGNALDSMELKRIVNLLHRQGIR